MKNRTISFDLAANSILGSREEQQDAFFYKKQKDTVLAVICDGMGGMADGAVASNMAINVLIEQYKKKPEEEPFFEFFLNIVDILDECVFRINQQSDDPMQSGTTLVAAGIQGDALYWLSVGDSRLYIIRGDEIVQVTRDQNYFLMLDEAYENGEISEEEYEEESVRGEALISYIGMGGIHVMDLNDTPLSLEDEDVILLMSDGLYRGVTEEEMMEIVQFSEDAKSMVAQLIALSQYNTADKSQDNTTVIAIKVTVEEEEDESNQM